MIFSSLQSDSVSTCSDTGTGKAVNLSDDKESDSLANQISVGLVKWLRFHKRLSVDTDL